MKVEIVICTYSRAEKLRRVIQSILNSEVPDSVDLNITVVNNNSTDNTEDVAKEFSRNNPKIRYLFEKKQGKSHALNTALKHITGDLIAFTDDDVTIDKGWIKEMINAFKRYPEYNCFGGKVIPVYPESIPKWLDIHESMRFLKSVFVDRDDGDLEFEYGVNSSSKVPSGVNMFFRWEVIEKNGLFRTDLGPMGKELGFSEDVEYCQRLLDKGERFIYIPTVIIYHPVYTERLNKEYLLRWQYKCGRSEVRRRNGGYKDIAKAFGVPRHLFRKCIQHVAGWGLSLQSKRRFYHRLKLYYTAGEIVEHLRIKLKKRALNCI